MSQVLDEDEFDQGLKPNRNQIEYIDECRKKVTNGSKQYFFNPHDSIMTGKPKYDILKLKPVYIIAIDTHFPNVKFKCTKCNKSVTSCGWQSKDRAVHVHCLKSSCYIDQKRLNTLLF